MASEVCAGVPLPFLSSLCVCTRLPMICSGWSSLAAHRHPSALVRLHRVACAWVPVLAGLVRRCIHALAFSAEIELAEAQSWYLFVDTHVNGSFEKHPWNIGVKDELQVRKRLSCCPSRSLLPDASGFLACRAVLWRAAESSDS